MQILENSNVKEKIYKEKLENGLTIMVIPKKETKKKYIIYGTNYGSIDNEFIMPEEQDITKVPDGVAHFLEHKLFEQENGTNSLDVLSALGVNANAYTTNNHTAYLFECTENFYKALDEFMNYIQNPYFTDENVEKEKGIIKQEIAMYDDVPDYKVYINAMESMYVNNSVRIDVAGTAETVSKIDKDILYKCYNTFYNPNNMAIVVCGDFEPEKIIEEIKERLINKKSLGEIKRIYKEEPENINNSYKEQIMEVSMPIFAIGIKDENSKEINIVKKHIAIEILLNILIGKSSKLYENLYKQGLILTEPEMSYEFSKEYAYILLQGQSKDTKKLYEELIEEIEKLKQNGIVKSDFERIRKMIYGGYIKEYNNIQEIGTMFLADYFKGINSFEYLEEYKTVTKEYTEEILKDTFKKEKMVLSVIKGK